MYLSNELRFATSIFLCATIWAIPFGISREILRGQQRFLLLNLSEIIALVISGGGIIFGCLNDWSLSALLIWSVGSSLLGPAIAWAAVLLQRETRPNPLLFRWKLLREVASFSTVAYIITASNVITLTIGPIIYWLDGGLPPWPSTRRL